MIRRAALLFLWAAAPALADPYTPGWLLGRVIGPPARVECGGYRTLGPKMVLRITEGNGASVEITGPVTITNQTLVLPPEPYASIALTYRDSAACIAAPRNPYAYADDILPNPAVAGATYTLTRAGLAIISLVDQSGAVVPSGTTTYTASLTAGTLTMANPLTLTGYTQPLVARLTWAVTTPETWPAVAWAPPVGFSASILEPGGLNAIHINGAVTVPSGATVSATGTPQRLPARLMSWTSATGTWGAGSLPAGTHLVQDPPGMPAGLYLYPN